jgi:outer membrane lipoprotein
MRRLAMLVALACASAGCASSPFPEELTRTVNRSLTLAEIRADPQAHLGEQVILGGDIIKAIPRPRDTEIEILARRLGGGDVPEGGDGSTGRFLVRTAGFLDPAIYTRGRRLTVLGTVVERVKLWPTEGPWLGGEYPPVPLDTPIVPYSR